MYGFYGELLPVLSKVTIIISVLLVIVIGILKKTELVLVTGANPDF